MRKDKFAADTKAECEFRTDVGKDERYFSLVRLDFIRSMLAQPADRLPSSAIILWI